MSTAVEYDLIIAGGGMVGASLAIALAGRGLRIALIEAHTPGADSQPSYDDRAIALAYGSRRIFEAVGVWPTLHERVEPILDIHVSDRGHFGCTRLHASDEGVPALGYVVTARELGRVLLDRLAQDAALEVIAPARVVSFFDHGDRVRVEIERAGVMSSLECRLLVAADGGQSAIREQLDVPVVRWQYAQSAIVTNVTPAQPHHNVAYERFTDTGPVALLPMSERRCAVVWTVRDAQVDEVLALDDAAFLAAFQQRFGYRLGRFQRAGRRAAYPLNLLRARESVRGRVAIIGNAAHTLHPIAGQGFNLGIRDVAALAEVVDSAFAIGNDIGAAEVLDRYERWRSAEQRNVALATDGLARLFSNPLAVARIGRNLGLLAMEFLPAAKHPLARAAMGQLGRQPRLARGVPLG
ncbi:MAG: 2-octaprenyl-6-methoxyphenyl hydroxylase [Chromatiaceae bacterium]|nr:2-octaprenyl-6-methoxyphenyl hydroxylase [Chromatiaceae bacterium]